MTTSMGAATGNIRLNFAGKLKEKMIGKQENVVCYWWSKKQKRRLSSLITASGQNQSSGRKLEKVNGTKVNGRHVAAEDISGSGSGSDAALVTSLHGRFVEKKFVYRQETALNHVTSSGIGGNGFGETREMSIRKLIWVVTRIQVQVQRYSSWGDVIEVDTWVDAAGKNGMRRDWVIRDHYTKEVITRATSTWVIMNRETRRLCKIPEEVRQEVVPFYLNRASIATEQTDSENIHKLTDDTAERIRSGLAPRWNDMDANQHVNNVKYIGWILESVAIKVLEDYYMRSMTLEYRRECRQSNLLESLTSPTGKLSGASASNMNNSIHTKPHLQFTHLLRLQAAKQEVVRARTEWIFKHTPNNNN
ncbi:palmitoyl-acyl carrier protein thioesterase, chloroplastic-like [Senna tora]|uniref:Acyl-[acyl-carrier-protein] hydrolase n=1 Tax=Senna tora TaxID=362788 RepID=A0A834WX55_9FABA|nr:palmitoyl-acyl carrier protein thioesterase, chloroplastic-like [Senna tora]